MFHSVKGYGGVFSNTLQQIQNEKSLPNLPEFPVKSLCSIWSGVDWIRGLLFTPCKSFPEFLVPEYSTCLGIKSTVNTRSENCRKFSPANRRHHNWEPIQQSSTLRVTIDAIESVRLHHEARISQYSLI